MGLEEARMGRRPSGASRVEKAFHELEEAVIEQGSGGASENDIQQRIKAIKEKIANCQAVSASGASVTTSLPLMSLTPSMGLQHHRMHQPPGLGHHPWV